MENWEMVIGLEVHIQLNTLSKAFCGDENRFGAEPNSLVCPISLAHPGTLPMVNRAQLAKAIQLGLALDCDIAETTSFDRKNYFYADLPKGYQITQDQAPICIGGQVILSNKTIRLHHIHMEEDAGKSIHDVNPKATLVDLNRAGVPLLELVTEPDFRSADEVEEFITDLRQLVRWLGVSDGNMEEGSLRCDVNLSLRPQGAKEYGTRCEIKNLNSMRFARRAIAFEATRQAKILDDGGAIRQETRQFIPSSGITKSLRDKEEAHDYRYFPDPDLPPVKVSAEELNNARKAMPELPKMMAERWSQSYDLSKADAALLTQSKPTALVFDQLAAKCAAPKELMQLFINKIIPYCKQENLALSDVPEEGILAFVQLLIDKKVAKSLAYQKLFPAWMERRNNKPEEVAKTLGLLLVESDQDVTGEWIEELISDHPDEVAKYRAGKKNLMGFFMGQLMRIAQGKIDPNAAREALAKALDK